MRGKHFLLWSLCLVLLCTGCQQTAPDFKDIASGGMFAYPGTQWNMTPEEVTAALSLTEEQFVQVSETETEGCEERIFLSEGHRLRGVPADLYFWFRSYSGYPGFGLKGVTWMFEEGADLEPVKRGLEEALGPMDSAHAEYPLFSWDSENTLAQYADGTLDGLLNEAVWERMKTEPAAAITLVDDPPAPLPVASYPAVDAHAKMVILSSNAADVMQLGDMARKSGS